MVQKQSLLKVADNSGAKIVQVICLLGGTRKKFAGLGDVVKVAVKKAVPNGSVKKGAVADALIVRVRKETRRANGTYISFDDNAAVLINNNEPVGTRVFGPVASELKNIVCPKSEDHKDPMTIKKFGGAVFVSSQKKELYDKVLSLAAQVV